MCILNSFYFDRVLTVHSGSGGIGGGAVGDYGHGHGRGFDDGSADRPRCDPDGALPNVAGDAGGS